MVLIHTKRTLKRTKYQPVKDSHSIFSLYFDTPFEIKIQNQNDQPN